MPFLLVFFALGHDFFASPLRSNLFGFLDGIFQSVSINFSVNGEFHAIESRVAPVLHNLMFEDDLLVLVLRPVDDFALEVNIFHHHLIEVIVAFEDFLQHDLLGFFVAFVEEDGADKGLKSVSARRFGVGMRIDGDSCPNRSRLTNLERISVSSPSYFKGYFLKRNSAMMASNTASPKYSRRSLFSA